VVPLRIDCTGSLSSEPGDAEHAVEGQAESVGLQGKEAIVVTARSYEIRVHGQISPDELVEFENVTAVEQPAGTVLRGMVADQAALQGILQRLHGLGLELTEVRRVSDCQSDGSGRGNP
jgi:hypothetical protein